MQTKLPALAPIQNGNALVISSEAWMRIVEHLTEYDAHLKNSEARIAELESLLKAQSKVIASHEAQIKILAKALKGVFTDA